MFKIWTDENGYYSTEDKGISVEVEDMPNDIADIKHLLAYKYNENTHLLELDEEKLEELETQVSNKYNMPTTEERLADLEAAFIEFSTMMLGGE